MPRTSTSTHPDRRQPAPRVRRQRQQPVWRRVLSTLLWSVIVLGGLAYATSVAVPLWFQAHGQRLLIVTSGSMSPVFDAGDAVVLRKVDDPSELKVNQIVSFWPLGSTSLVTHRVVSLATLPKLQLNVETRSQEPVIDPTTGKPVVDHYILTKGDANPEPDPNATPISRVRGIVLGSHPGWGFVLQWCGSPVGRAVMLVPPLLALGLLEVLAVRDQRRRTSAKKDAEARRVEALLLD